MDEAKHLGLINMILFIEPRFFRTEPVRMTRKEDGSLDGKKTRFLFIILLDPKGASREHSAFIALFQSSE